MHLVLVNCLGSLPRNSVVRLTDHLDMTIVIDRDAKPQIKQTNITLQRIFQDSPVPTIHGPHSRAPPMVLPRAQTLEEIEGSLIPRHRKSSKPKVLTAEELERQLRGEATQPVNRTPPPMAQFVQNGHPSPGNFGVLPPNMGNTPPRPMVNTIHLLMGK